MKNLIGLAAIAAALSLLALPAAAGGGHRGQVKAHHGPKRSTFPAIHTRVRDLSDQVPGCGTVHWLNGTPGKHGKHGKNGHNHLFGNKLSQLEEHGHYHVRSDRHKRNYRPKNFKFEAPAAAYAWSHLFELMPLPWDVIENRLSQSCYYPIGLFYLKRGYYHVKVWKPGLSRVKLVIHAGSGTIVHSRDLP